jgi:hypothetical protein
MTKPTASFMGAIRRLSAVAAIVASSAAGLALTTPAASASSTCGSVLVPGSQWLGGRGVNVYSNGAYKGTATSCGGFGTTQPATQAGNAWQCAELSARFLYVRYGAAVIMNTNGAQIVDHYVAAHPSEFVAVANGTPGQAPEPGDVISLSTTSLFSDTGHTQVVTGSNVDANGNGTVSVVQQNASSTGTAAYTPRSWVLPSMYGFGHIGVRRRLSTTGCTRTSGDCSGNGSHHRRFGRRDPLEGSRGAAEGPPSAAGSLPSSGESAQQRMTKGVGEASCGFSSLAPSDTRPPHGRP